MFIRSIRISPKSVRFQSSKAYLDAKSLLKTDLKKSMLAKDTIKKDTVKGLLSSIKNKEIDTKPEQHDEFLLFELYSKSISQRKDSVKQYLELNRLELAEKENKEIEIISNYLNQLPVASQLEIDLKVKDLLINLQKNGELKLNQIFGKIDWNLIKNDWKASESSVRSTIVKQFRNK